MKIDHLRGVALSGSPEGMILSDFDGVFNQGSPEAYEHVFVSSLRDVGIHLEYDEIVRLIALQWGSSPRRILSAMVEPDLLDEVLKRYRGYMRTDFPNMTSPVAGALEVLDELADDHILALNTAADKKALIDTIMPRLGLDPDIFIKSGGIHAAEEIPEGKQKPHPYLIELLMGKYEIPKNRTIMVGDSLVDMFSAQAAGVEPVAVLTGNMTEYDAREIANVGFVIETVASLTPVVYTHLGRAGLKLSYNDQL